MTRNTHDADLDHHGHMPTTKVALSADTTTYHEDDELQGVIADIDDRVEAAGAGSGSISVTDGSTTVNPTTSIAFTGASVVDASGGVAEVTITGGGGGNGFGFTDLITGDSSEFASSTGSWAHTGGTMTHETGTVLPWRTGSLKFVATATSQRIDLELPGTFVAGVQYQIAYFLQGDGSNNPMSILFGDPGSDYTSHSLPYAGQNWLYLSTQWTPSADRTSVVVRFIAEISATTMYLGDIRLVRGPGAPAVITPNSTGKVVLPINSAFDTGSFSPFGDKAGNVFFPAGTIYYEAFDGNAGTDASDNGSVYLYAWHDAPGDFADDGLEISVGTDGVGIYISEKDPGTIQLYPDFSSGYDIELKNRGVGVWKLVTDDGLGEAVPSMGMLPRYSSAPHSSTETEAESYYDTTLHKARTWDGSAWKDWWS